MSLAQAPTRYTAAAMLSFVMVVLQASGAAAEEDKAKAAKKACISGDFAKGVELLSDLYVETNDPNFVFNQGRCFEQNGRYQDALNRFREYARKLNDAGKSVDPSVERHIADCQAMLGKASPPPAPMPVQPPGLPAPVTPAVSPAPAPTTPAMPPADLAQPARKSNPGSGLRSAGLAVGGLGVAGLAIGVILNVKANQLTDELQRSELSYSQKRDATRSSYKTWGWVSYGVGAACVAGGAALYLLGRRHGQSEQLAFVPVAGPGQVGAVMQGGF